MVSDIAQRSTIHVQFPTTGGISTFLLTVVHLGCYSEILLIKVYCKQIRAMLEQSHHSGTGFYSRQDRLVSASIVRDLGSY